MRTLRLTGRHPLNCEPPMSDLMASGFITPPSIHYVRNHGITPKIMWPEHRIAFVGLVDYPCSISMDELVALPSITLPVTLVCSGNRCVPVLVRGWGRVDHAVASSLWQVALALRYCENGCPASSELVHAYPHIEAKSAHAATCHSGTCHPIGSSRSLPSKKVLRARRRLPGLWCTKDAASGLTVP
jgi:hypothetical protein